MGTGGVSFPSPLEANAGCLPQRQCFPTGRGQVTPRSPGPAPQMAAEGVLEPKGDSCLNLGSGGPGLREKQSCPVGDGQALWGLFPTRLLVVWSLTLVLASSWSPFLCPLPRPPAPPVSSLCNNLPRTSSKPRRQGRWALPVLSLHPSFPPGLHP